MGTETDATATVPEDAADATAERAAPEEPDHPAPDQPGTPADEVSPTEEAEETPAASTGQDAETAVEPTSQADAPQTDALATGVAGAAAGAAIATPWERAAAPESEDDTGKDAETDSTGEDSKDEESPAPRDATAASAAPPERIVEKTVIRRGGFVTAFLGGVVAAALGFGAARYVVPEGWPFPGTTGGTDFRSEVQSRLDTQAGQIDSLESEFADLEASIPDAPDLAPLETRIEDTASTLNGRIDEMASRLDELESQVTDLAKAPMEQGASDEAIAAYESELQALQDAVAEQRAEVERMVSDATDRERAAADAARMAQAGSALSRVRSALDEGTPFPDALSDLRGALDAPVPDALAAAAQDGVAPLSTLREDFPEAARAALSAARRDATPEEDGAGSRLTAFFEKQLNVRSVSPRDGDDPDAVLSRAEDALRDGRLGDTLSEIAALPEAARAELSDWAARAQARHDAVTAAETLAQSLNQ
ncbi:MAG: hypothetical protein ACLFRU_00430 [Paracoccaceae bacterium]